MMRTANPALSSRLYDRIERQSGSKTMTTSGAVNKIGILLMLAVFAAYWSYQQSFTGIAGDQVALTLYPIGGAIVGFVLSLIIIFVPKTAPMLAPIYAIAEGLLLGGVSALAESRYPGVANQAVLATFTTLGAMLVLYRLGVLRATAAFRSGVLAATGGLLLLYLGSWIAGFFGADMSFMRGNSNLSIGISVFACGIAALNLILDFDTIEQGERRQAPKWFEWYAAFGMMVTLVWLYLEMLRLLSKVQSRR